jgi:ribosome production factor 1
VYDSSSYLTADPATLRAAAEKAAEASKALNADDEEDEDDEDADEDMGESDEEEDEEETSKAGPSRLPAAATSIKTADGPTTEETPTGTPSVPAQPTLPPGPPPRIMITTSPSPCKDTYAFCEDLKGIFPGGEFFKRPKGKGFEIGRVARWAAKRGFNAVCVVNEDHKLASESMPAGR